MTNKKITASERWFLKQMEDEEFRLEFHKARQERLFEEMKSLVGQTEVNLEEVIEGQVEELNTFDEGSNDFSCINEQRIKFLQIKQERLLTLEESKRLEDLTKLLDLRLSRPRLSLEDLEFLKKNK